MARSLHRNPNCRDGFASEFAEAETIAQSTHVPTLGESRRQRQIGLRKHLFAERLDDLPNVLRRLIWKYALGMTLRELSLYPFQQAAG